MIYSIYLTLYFLDVSRNAQNGQTDDSITICMYFSKVLFYYNILYYKCIVYTESMIREGSKNFPCLVIQFKTLINLNF